MTIALPGASKRLETHVLAALRAVASKRWHGKGCHRSNCGSVCLCAPCHAREALYIIDNQGEHHGNASHHCRPAGR